MIKIWKKQNKTKQNTFPKEIINEIVVKVGEHEYIYVAGIKSENVILGKKMLIYAN